MLLRWTDRLDLHPPRITVNSLTVELDEQGFVLADLDVVRAEKLLGTGQFAPCSETLDAARAKVALDLAASRPKPIEQTIDGCIGFLLDAAAKDPSLALRLAELFRQVDGGLEDEPAPPPPSPEHATRSTSADPVPLILPDEDDFEDPFDSSPESLGQTRNASLEAQEVPPEDAAPQGADPAAERLAEAFSLQQQYLSDRKGLQKVLKGRGVGFSPRDSVTTLISKLLHLPEGWEQQG